LFHALIFLKKNKTVKEKTRSMPCFQHKAQSWGSVWVDPLGSFIHKCICGRNAKRAKGLRQNQIIQKITATEK
jgi:hypothetical protein